MKVTRSSRSASNYIALGMCLGAFLIIMIITAGNRSPDLEGGRVITGLLAIALLFATVNVARRLISPLELRFEIRDGRITIVDLKGSGHGYRKLSFPQAEVARVHFSRDSEYASFIETVSGHRTKLAGEIFDSWPAIRKLLADEAPEIEITEQ